MKVGFVRLLLLILTLFLPAHLIACAQEGTAGQNNPNTLPNTTGTDSTTAATATGAATAGTVGAATAGATGAATAGTVGTDSADGTDGATATGATDGADSTSVPPTPRVTCNVQPTGVLSTPETDIIYQNNAVTASATHVKGLGCVNTMTVTYSIDGGCQLKLDFETVNSNWKLVSGVFNTDEKCGDAIGTAINYTLDAEGSKAAVVGHPDSVDEPAASDSCLTSPKFYLVGWAKFVAGTTTITTSFSGLGIKGAVHSVATTDGQCPKAFDPCVDGQVCGSNAYGYNCGECGAGLDCMSGYCMSKASNCNPLGTGKAVGDKIANITWIDSDGLDLSMHNWCGDTAIWLIKTAGW